MKGKNMKHLIFMLMVAASSAATATNDIVTASKVRSAKITISDEGYYNLTITAESISKQSNGESVSSRQIDLPNVNPICVNAAITAATASTNIRFISIGSEESCEVSSSPFLDGGAG